MGKKIWVIEDSPEKQVSATRTSQTNISTFQQKNTEQRNPSLAYSLSIIIWGCGQFYNKQWRSGTLFFLFMIMFYAFMGIAVMNWESIASVFESVYVNRSEAFIILSIFYLLGLLVWHYNAWQAYFRSININQKAPKGLKGTLLPGVCSLLMPGWGQLLNGQTKKGLFFVLFFLTGLVTLPFIVVTLLVWPTLDASRSRIIIEWIFSISVILSPFLLFIWIVNIFDAIIVSMDNTKKESLRIKIKYATKRFRYHIQVYGWKNALLALIKRSTLAILLLICCGISYHYVPKKFYMQQLQNIEKQMSEKDMTVIPTIIKKLSNNVILDK